MGKIFGQKVPLKILYNANKRDSLPQTILMHGPEGVGKLETAINFVKSIYCVDKKFGFCDNCSSCQNIQFQRSQQVIALTNDDRLPNIKFYLHILTNNLTTKPSFIKYQLIGELGNLLSRIKNAFLLPLSAEKKSYPQGIKLTQKQWEDTISSGYKILEELEKISLNKNYNSQLLIETFEKIQNGLDRSIISKQGLDKFFKFSNLSTNKTKVFILQNIQLISYQVTSGLLKILEEPPPNNLFILITKNLSDVPFQIITPLRSRCFELSFKHLSLLSQKKIFKEKMGIDNNKLSATSISQNMFSFINETNNQNIKYDQLLEIFNNKRYNINSLFEYSQQNSLELLKIISYYRNFLDEVILAKKENPSNLSIAKIHIMLSLLSNVESLIMQTNISEKNLILRLLVGIARII